MRSEKVRSATPPAERRVHGTLTTMIVVWLAFFALVGALLAIHRKVSRPRVTTPLIWFLIGLAFVGVVYPLYEKGWLGAKLQEPSDSPGSDASVMYVSSYLLEYVISFDAVMVILELCRTNLVPRWHWPRILFWGLVGTVFARSVILTGAAWIARALPWASYLFGAMLLCSAYAASRPREHGYPSVTRWVLKPVLRLARIAKGDHDGAFVVGRDGRRFLTTAGACVLAIVLNEILFAGDSVALLSVSKTTFVLVAATTMATIAQRCWLYAYRLETIRPPQRATAALLGVVGVKMLAQRHLHLPAFAWLATIIGFVCMGIMESANESDRGKVS